MTITAVEKVFLGVNRKIVPMSFRLTPKTDGSGTQEQTSEIKEGNDKILSALDQIAKNTGKKKGGLLSKLFSLLGKGAGGVASLLMGRGMLKKLEHSLLALWGQRNF
ncbi:putative structural injection transglycosylase [Escherichia coli]|uniref:Putative structural injection transglycosylase n=1 Tax=Escherichia coli TaxID=562 RepID=A0A376YK11_ECOLX|nr:putative structural injection transglycosylase [Escherichia coli]